MGRAAHEDRRQAHARVSHGRVLQLDPIVAPTTYGKELVAVTIHTLSVGADANTDLMEAIAHLGGGIHIIVEGLVRARSDLVNKSGASLRAIVAPAPDSTIRSLEVDAYVRRLQELIDRALSLSSGLSQELRGLVRGIDDPLRLAYLLSSLLDMKADEKQQILEQQDLTAKLQAVASALNREIALLEMNGEFYPKSPSIDFQIAELHLARGERALALARYRAVLDKAPDHAAAKQRLAELEKR